jgi:hypothetical protein
VISRIDAKVGIRDKSAAVDVDYELPLNAVTEAIVNAHRGNRTSKKIIVYFQK